jgi:hypothetical protein
MSAEHTPTPWRADESEPAGQVILSSTVAFGPGQKQLCNVGHLTCAANDAEFIVRAVNCHDDLVAALKEAIAELNDWCEEESGESYNNPRFNDLLAKAEGRS